MKIYVMKGEYLDERTYLLVKGEDALVIDPGASAERILKACESLSVKPFAVLLTHGHCDHIFGAAALQRDGVMILAHEAEIPVISGRANLALAFSMTLEAFTPDHTFSHEEEGLRIGPFYLKVYHTPGHTQGSVCYLTEGALFTGDTLFKSSYGRTDFPTGDEQDMLCSIANVLFELPKNTAVYAGHGDILSENDGGIRLAVPDTTIGEEYSTNPILDLL